jgi:hypothetical protein
VFPTLATLSGISVQATCDLSPVPGSEVRNELSQLHILKGCEISTADVRMLSHSASAPSDSESGLCF